MDGVTTSGGVGPHRLGVDAEDDELRAAGVDLPVDPRADRGLLGDRRREIARDRAWQVSPGKQEIVVELFVAVFGRRSVDGCGHVAGRATPLGESPHLRMEATMSLAMAARSSGEIAFKQSSVRSRSMPPRVVLSVVLSPVVTMHPPVPRPPRRTVAPMGTP